MIAVVCGLGALWAAALYRGRITHWANRLLALLDAFPAHAGLLRWLVTRRLTALLGVSSRLTM